jgi:rare lipoprotein A (peptidoglycan hydrolase)
MAGAMTAEKAGLGQTVTVTATSTDSKGNLTTKSISVVVNDRGPFARNADGKAIHPLSPDPKGVIDLTPVAFKQLTGTLKAGRVHVTVTVPNE